MEAGKRRQTAVGRRARQEAQPKETNASRRQQLMRITASRRYDDARPLKEGNRYGLWATVWILENASVTGKRPLAR